MEVQRLRELASAISQHVNKIEKHLESKSLPYPSFEAGAAPLPEELVEAQDAVLHATGELHDLLMDPVNALHSYGNVRRY